MHVTKRCGGEDQPVIDDRNIGHMRMYMNVYLVVCMYFCGAQQRGDEAIPKIFLAR